MLHLKEVTFVKGNKIESDILINPYLVAAVRKAGLHTSLFMLGGQEVTLLENFFEIKKMLTKYILRLVDLDCISKELK